MIFLEAKFKCEECGWRGEGHSVLIAENPFDAGSSIVGCPKCREVDTMIRMCDHTDCSHTASCGSPTKEGYTFTCYEHAPLIYQQIKLQP